MSTRRRLPFQNLDAHAWQNLGMMAVFAFYLAFTGWELFYRGPLVSLGIDYRAYWSAGRIANTLGYAKVNDLEALDRVQTPLIPKSQGFTETLPLNTAAYLPAFILPFQALALLPPAWSFLTWTIINLAALILYLCFFHRSLTSTPLPKRLMLMALLAFPIFWNFFYGQVNVWLMICAGEFLRCSLQERPFRAGLWLGGLWLKPTILILLGPALVMQRAWKTLAGFILASSFILLVSIKLAGLPGIVDMLTLWLGFTKNLVTDSGKIVTSAPEYMTNWRMLALYLGNLVHPAFGWSVAVLGMFLTALGGLYLWRRRLSPSLDLAIALVGIFAATFATTWHSHVYTMMVLTPLLIHLYQQKALPEVTLNLWTFAPAGTTFLAIIFTLIIRLVFDTFIDGIGVWSIGMTGLGLNLYLLVWAIQTLRQRRSISVSEFEFLQ